MNLFNHIIFYKVILNFLKMDIYINNLIKSDNLTKALDEICNFYKEEPLITNFKDSLYLLKINSEILSLFI